MILLNLTSPTTALSPSSAPKFELVTEIDQLGRACRRAELTPPVHRRAERLLLSSRDVVLRSLDALHLASALATDAATLVTYDPRLRAAAIAQGLFVPEALTTE